MCVIYLFKLYSIFLLYLLFYTHVIGIISMVCVPDKNNNKKGISVYGWCDQQRSIVGFKFFIYGLIIYYTVQIIIAQLHLITLIILILLYLSDDG